ncbi:acetoin utilization protein AcuC [Desulfuribacillus alkaliarsenatis]|uniref:Acetoin utilization protein AcuC n=1 Tax=Desulfuribacillus alkaliarsenatis TaxID=766136 RepID=A0A1E5G507_9FIRM|nr:acetoin utilization protein AcuC [Desulfuribacillus alkaliarsenatis]OEF98256.1 histone deacetylase [Desulfuribacillus alkaliarsenatis]
MNNKSLFFHDPRFYKYRFGEDHPFNPLRLELTVDLIEQMNLLKPEQIVSLTEVSDALLGLVHCQEYIDEVKMASTDINYSSSRFGLGTEDTPTFENMHQVSSLVVGGTVQAAESVMQGICKHALNLGGGLHHSFASRASGFCIYNDAAVAIKYLQQKYKARVLYLDTDAHHGDGVQSIFYNDPTVLTISFHETGKYLFPGTGHIHERGAGEGFGYSYNIPLEPFTEDDSFKEVLFEVLPSVVESFKPDIIISQNGCDAHYLDPLTHLYTTIDIFAEIPKLVHQLAHTYCSGRWVAIGGGGYDLWRVVPRAWTLLWAEMNNQDIMHRELPNAWIDKWQASSPVTLPTHMQDPEKLYEPVPRKAEIDEKNTLTAKKVLHKL